jgi:signal transduction histidine kinase
MIRNLSLPLKLSLAFALTVLVAVGAVAMLVNAAASQHLSVYVARGMAGRAAAYVPALSEYYQTHQGWSGVQAWLELSNAPRGAGQGRGMMGGMSLILTDASGTVLYSTASQGQGTRLGKSTLAEAQPIVVGGETVGYLASGTGPQEDALRQDLNRSILSAGALATLVAVLAGLLLTRTILRPLRRLREAAQEIGAGRLDHRVPVESADEIGALGSVFNDMAAALRRDEQLRQQMMADIAHELRTPVAVMRGQAEALQDGIFPLTVENLAPIHDQTLLLGRLINDLRDLALAEADQLPLDLTEMSLLPLARRVVSAFQPQALAEGLRLEGQWPASLPNVCADAQRIEQVLGNLLSNAIRYTPAGGAVTVRLWTEAGQVLCAVSDTGPGISPTDLPHVFDRFYRVDKARSRAEGGSGLGLSIAHRLAQAHEGALTAQSVLGQGSTFTLRLPVCPASAQDA